MASISDLKSIMRRYGNYVYNYEFLIQYWFSLKTRLNSKETGLRLFSLTTVVKHSFVTFCRHFCELFKAFLSTSWGESFSKECGSQRKVQFYCIFSLAVKRTKKEARTCVDKVKSISKECLWQKILQLSLLSFLSNLYSESND